MTDKEKKYKIADILLDFYDEYHSNEINRPMIPSIYAGKILDSMQEEPTIPDIVDEHFDEMLGEEPVSEPNKELAETYLAVFNKKLPILPSLNGKQLADYKNFLNKCQQIFSLEEWGIRPIQSKLFEKLSLLWAAWGAEHLQGVGRQDEKEQDIPVSKELEEELPKVWDRETLDEYAYQVAYDLSNDWLKETATWDDVETAVKLGAKWQEDKDQGAVEIAREEIYEWLRKNHEEYQYKAPYNYFDIEQCIDDLKQAMNYE